MAGPILRNPLDSPVIPQWLRDAMAWVDAPAPEDFWTRPRETGGAGAALNETVRGLSEPKLMGSH